MSNVGVPDKVLVDPMSDKRPVMAIDSSLRGFCIAVEGPDIPLVTKEIKTLSKDWSNDVIGRIERYKHIVKVAIAYAKAYLPVLVLIEGYSHHSKGRGVLQLAELGGVLRYVLIGYGDSTVEVPPTVLKKFATGRGNASKTLIVQQLCRRYDRIFNTDNEADAYALLRLGFVVVGYAEGKTKFEVEAVDTINRMYFR
jgi:Holliday junction resolvasome RuvABC endonuclease subunit